MPFSPIRPPTPPSPPAANGSPSSSWPKLTKGLIARIRNGAVKGTLSFQYNPTSIRRSASVEWSWGLGPGGFLPVATFGKMGEQNISLELLFFSREDPNSSLFQGLRGVLSEAESLALPAVDRWNAKKNALAVAPDRVMLILGHRYWHCEIVSCDIGEEMFDPELAVVKATVSYELRLVNVGASAIKNYVDTLRSHREVYEKVQPNPMTGRTQLDLTTLDKGY